MSNKSETVYAFIAWDDDDEQKVVFLCKSEEMAEQLKENYKKSGYTHTKIEEIPIYESLNDAEGWLI